MGFALLLVTQAEGSGEWGGLWREVGLGDDAGGEAHGGVGGAVVSGKVTQEGCELFPAWVGIGVFGIHVRKGGLMISRVREGGFRDSDGRAWR